jgi:hypothetical protein
MIKALYDIGATLFEMPWKRVVAHWSVVYPWAAWKMELLFMFTHSCRPRWFVIY